MLAAVLVLAALSAGLGYLVWHHSRHGLLSERVRRRVIVTLKTGEAFSGLLASADREVLVLVEASALAYGPQSEDVPVEGEALIQRRDIAYMQLP